MGAYGVKRNEEIKKGLDNRKNLKKNKYRDIESDFKTTEI